jgi:hypothetical protein
MAAIWKLFAIVLLLAASIAMTAAPAAATGSHHAPGAAVPMQHCPDQDGKADMKGGVPECAMACSAALPAADRPADSPLVIICVPANAGLASALHGLHPETATPPPRRS